MKGPGAGCGWRHRTGTCRHQKEFAENSRWGSGGDGDPEGPKLPRTGEQIAWEGSGLGNSSPQRTGGSRLMWERGTIQRASLVGRAAGRVTCPGPLSGSIPRPRGMCGPPERLFGRLGGRGPGDRTRAAETKHVEAHVRREVEAVWSPLHPSGTEMTRAHSLGTDQRPRWTSSQHSPGRQCRSQPHVNTPSQQDACARAAVTNRASPRLPSRVSATSYDPGIKLLD